MAGAAVSVTHGVQELLHPVPASDFLVGYIVLAVSFVLEGISFLRSVQQARPTAKLMQRDLIGAVMFTSDPTLRAVFAEDSDALIGLGIAAVGLGANRLTGSSTPDAVGSILVGLLLAAVATYLIDRNREFLVGQEGQSRTARSGASGATRRARRGSRDLPTPRIRRPAPVRTGRAVAGRMIRSRLAAPEVRSAACE